MQYRYLAMIPEKELLPGGASLGKGMLVGPEFLDDCRTLYDQLNVCIARTVNNFEELVDCVFQNSLDETLFQRFCRYINAAALLMEKVETGKGGDFAEKIMERLAANLADSNRSDAALKCMSGLVACETACSTLCKRGPIKIPYVTFAVLLSRSSTLGFDSREKIKTMLRVPLVTMPSNVGNLQGRWEEDRFASLFQFLDAFKAFNACVIKMAAKFNNDSMGVMLDQISEQRLSEQGGAMKKYYDSIVDLANYLEIVGKGMAADLRGEFVNEIMEGLATNLSDRNRWKAALQCVLGLKACFMPPLRCEANSIPREAVYNEVYTMLFATEITILRDLLRLYGLVPDKFFCLDNDAFREFLKRSYRLDPNTFLVKNINHFCDEVNQIEQAEVKKVARELKSILPWSLDQFMLHIYHEAYKFAVQAGYDDLQADMERSLPEISKSLRPEEKEAVHDMGSFLSYLVLPHSRLTKIRLAGVDEGCCLSEALRKKPMLRELAISDSRSLTTLALEEVPGLTTLTLNRLFFLRDLSLNLPGLEELTLNNCANLKELPLKDLTGLKKLTITHSLELNELDGLERLTSLEELNISFTHKVKSLDGLEGLPNVKALKVSNCRGLASLPSSLPGLEKLELQGCPSLTCQPAVRRWV